MLKSYENLDSEFIRHCLVNLAEHSRDVFWIRSPDYRKQIYLSPVFEKIWGVSCTEIYSNPDSWLKYIHPDDIKKLEQSIAKRNKQKAKQGDCYYLIYRIIRADRQVRWIRDQSFPVLDVNNQNKIVAFAGFAQDITEEQERELKLKDANIAKSNFLGIVSHELRTPLNAILGLTKILANQTTDPENKHIIHLITQASDNLYHMINDILEFTKLEAGKISINPRQCHIKKFLEEIVYLYQQQLCDSHVKIKLSISKKIPEVLLIDFHRLRQILNNLIGNAIKFTKQGTISVRVFCEKIPENKIKIKFEIEDTGIGIPEDKLERLFERFYQVDSDQKYSRAASGFGLGLSICKLLLEAMGGSITVKSTQGKGTVFSFDFNCKALIQENTTRHLVEQKVNPKPTNNKKKFGYHVLLAEDDPINQKLFSYYMQILGCTLEIANNGIEGYKLCSKNRYDIIFCDLGMPDMDGIKFIEKVRKTLPEKSNTPIVTVTAHILDEDIKNCYAAGAQDVVGKPIELKKLAEILSNLNPV